MSQRPGYGWIREVVQTLGLTLVIFFFIQSCVAQPYRVEQQSMERTLLPDQYVLVDKLTPRFDAYKRGDIVVFKPPTDWAQQNGTPFIKRVIGVAGDQVEIEGGRVVVNDVTLDEPYVFQVDGQPQSTETTTEPPHWSVGENELFVMGDHRSSSSDSRTFGPIGADDVVGRAWLRYWPADTISILPTPVHPELQTTSP